MRSSPSTRMEPWAPHCASYRLNTNMIQSITCSECKEPQQRWGISIMTCQCSLQRQVHSYFIKICLSKSRQKMETKLEHQERCMPTSLQTSSVQFFDVEKDSHQFELQIHPNAATHSTEFQLLNRLQRKRNYCTAL